MGNCKSCIKPKTSDDRDRPSRVSIGEQGALDAEGALATTGPSAERVSSRASVKRVSSRASGRSKTGGSKSDRPVSAASQALHSSENQEVAPALKADVEDLNRRSSTRTSQRILSSGSVRNKKNIIFVRSAESDDYSFEGRDFKDICFNLWQNDERLAHNKDYKFSRNKGLEVYLTEAFYKKRPTFRVFRELLMIYTEENGNKIRRISLENEFLDEVMVKEVMQICWAFLNHAQYFVSDRNAFKQKLSAIWFPHAFQHIFAGDSNGDQVSGLHNWLQFSLEKENIDYEGCKKQIPGIMVNIKYRWNGIPKNGGSMFIGTSPEFELALYTLLFFQALRERPRSNENTYETTFDLNLGGKCNDPPNISIRIVVESKSNCNYPYIENSFLKTAYPMKTR